MPYNAQLVNTLVIYRASLWHIQTLLGLLAGTLYIALTCPNVQIHSKLAQSNCIKSKQDDPTKNAFKPFIFLLFCSIPTDEASIPSPGPTSGPNTFMTPNHTGGIHLWQFLKDLLVQPDSYGYCIRWLDRPQGMITHLLDPTKKRLFVDSQSKERYLFDPSQRDLLDPTKAKNFNCWISTKQ